MNVSNRNVDVLILSLRRLSQSAVDDLSVRHADERVALVDLHGNTTIDLPERWQRIERHELLDMQQARHDFLEMLDQWPRRTLIDGKSFDDLFRQQGNDSVWWTTGPGAHRDQTPKSNFTHLHTLWLCDRAIKRMRPKLVVVSSGDRRMTAMLESRCKQSDCKFTTAPDSARPAGSAWRGQSIWLARALLTLAAYPLWALARSVLARVLAGSPHEADGQRSEPAVVITGWYPRHVRPNGRKLDVWYWREVVDALESRGRNLRVRFLLYTQKFPLSGIGKFIRPFYTGWSGLRKIDRAGSIPQVHPAIGEYLAALPRQWSALVRYRRLERSAQFRRSFEFAGADVSPLMIPLVRKSIAGIAKWAQTVGSMAASLERMGNVKVVLVQEEFYPKGMQTIAAARRLGIPTVGMQHGSTGPTHLVYRVPRGHVEEGPVPDFFSAYGEYAKEAVSRWGAYPADRVWVTGISRFDPIVRRAADVDAARRRLDLPSGKFIVLLTTWRHTASREPSRAVFEVAAGHDDVLVCLKTHPNWSDTTEYRELARRAGAHNVRFYKDGLDDLMAACDLMISGSSTTLLEAILAGKATISVNFQDEPDRYPYVADGGSLGARSVEELRDAIERIRSGRDDLALQESRRRFLERHVGPTAEGRAAETLVALIEEHFLDAKQETLARCA